MAQVKIKKLDPNATIPTSGSAFAAGYDLYACLSGDGEVMLTLLASFAQEEVRSL